MLVALAGAAVVWRRGSQVRDWLLLGSLLVVLLAGWVVWRPVANPAAPPPGLPVLLEVQSPYCLGCVAMKPSVDRVEREWAARLAVRRVDIQSAAGRQLARQYRVAFTPTFILLDATGREQWRGVGQLDIARLRALVEAPP